MGSNVYVVEVDSKERTQKQITERKCDKGRNPLI